MVRWFIDLVDGAVPAQFESAYSISDSVTRLARVVKPSVLNAFAGQCAVGTVTDSKVSLQRVIPFFGNAWKPFFVGSFKLIDNRTVLEGRFTAASSTKIFMSAWFGGVALLTGVLTVGLFSGHTKVPWAPLFGVALFACGIALVYSGRWLSRNDIAWLSNVITRALGRNDAQL